MDRIGAKADQWSPSVAVPESLTCDLYGADVPFGGRRATSLSRLSSQAVLVPESFRGGCSVGADIARKSTTTAVPVSPAWPCRTGF